jgi:hypothetical protein
MAVGDVNFGAQTICRVGDMVEVTAEHGEIGSWSYTARILWIRAGHLGLSPPAGSWQSAIVRDGRLSLLVRHHAVTATLVTRAVGITDALPPVLVVRQEAAVTPVWQEGSVAVSRPQDRGPGSPPPLWRRA